LIPRAAFSRSGKQWIHGPSLTTPEFRDIFKEDIASAVAYSLFLFIRDVADGDLVGWIDRQLQAANELPGPPLREVYGLSDKVPTLALSCILLGAPKKMNLWIEVGEFGSP
jgi:hypothetical protein